MNTFWKPMTLKEYIDGFFVYAVPTLYIISSIINIRSHRYLEAGLNIFEVIILISVFKYAEKARNRKLKGE